MLTITSLETRLSILDFVSQLWSCETKSGTESLVSRLDNNLDTGQKCKVHQCNSEVYCFGICESDLSTVVVLEYWSHAARIREDLLY